MKSAHAHANAKLKTNAGPSKVKSVKNQALRALHSCLLLLLGS